MEPPPPSPIPERTKEQKILELIYKMVEILTGEVPIRCQDVAVYLSMEEWEYVEGHKDLYPDIMEDPRPLTSPDLPKHNINDRPPMLVNDDPVGCDGENLRNPDTCSLSDHVQLRPAPNIKQEMTSSEEPNTGHTQQYLPSRIKGDPDSQQERRVLDPIILTLTNYNHYPSAHGVKEAFIMGDGGNFTDTYALSHHTQQYPPPNIKEEPALQEPTDSGIYTPTDHSQLYSSGHLMGEQVASPDKDPMDANRPADHRSQHPTIKEEPASCDGGYVTDCDRYTQHPTIKEEPTSCDGGYVTDCDRYTQHPTIKEEPTSCDGGYVTDCDRYTQHPTIKEEPTSCDGGYVTDCDRYTQHPTIKEEPTSCDGGYVTDCDRYTQHPTIKEEPASCSTGNSTATKLYSPDCSPQSPSVPSIKEPVTCERRNFWGPIDHTQQHPSTQPIEEALSPDQEDRTGPNSYTPSDHTWQHPSTHLVEEPNPTDSDLCLSTNGLVSFTDKNLYNNYGYIFTEHTYTHLYRNKINHRAGGFVEHFMGSLPHIFGVSAVVEGFSPEARLAEIQYISNHVRSADWGSTKANQHNVFLSKCIEYEKHFCKVSRARICGTHLTEWSFTCSECQNCLNATLKLMRQNLKPREGKEKSKTSPAEAQAEEKDFGCLDCGKHFPKKRYLLTHRRVHSRENPFHCPACGQSFESQEGFANHQKNPLCERPFSCSECGKRFKSRYNSEYHKKTHMENKKYLCPVCGKSFRKQSCFIVHERTHTGEKPYACPECGRCFSQNASLISHQRLHTGEKPFACTECGRNFTQRISLVVHQRVHSGDRPYKCQECGKGFTQRIGLVQHQRRHTGEKPYTCSECGKSFTLHDSLVKHLRTHTGEKPYVCAECGKRFCQSSQLTAHRRFHHAATHNTGDNV
ncbi:oocyte zinc finger protein XlCOF7.1-like isoform X4 [Hyla sarda]|nr:oocyte zinc finger protein XlCOF7.1-like isoform X4 [Hyla sarda]XP_056386994.1 oocyte zinc finger protein XlCOF7.1-like isoform X4 [Hyla sarda]